MLGRSGRSLDRSARQSGGATLRDDDTVGAGCIGSADQCAQIVRIFHAVEHHQKTVLTVTLVEQGVHVRVLLAAGYRYDALMSVGVGGAIELFARQKAHLRSEEHTSE